jgi:pSer/pThr/pTyr-binding forkhead associated (FHA) protein
MDETVYKRSLKGKEIAHGSKMKQFQLRFQDQTIAMTRSIRIGRDSNNDLVISDDPLVSRRHAIIELIGGRYQIRDLGSTNQTYLNNEPVPPQSSVVVRSGDTITIGHTRIEMTRI